MDLDEQLRWLESTLLTNVSSGPLDQLTEQERAAVAGYLVLAHACIEEAIEDAFLLHAKALLAIVANDPSAVPMAVANFGLSVGVKLPETKRAPYGQRTLLNTLRAALVNYESTVIDQNHGIKEQNLHSLAEGVGVEWGRFDVALSTHIADLETLGAKRGKVGHLSPFSDKAVLVRAVINAVDALQWVSAAETAVSAISSYLKREREPVTNGGSKPADSAPEAGSP